MQSRHRWILPPEDAEAEPLGRALDLLPAVARLLCRRGYRDVDVARRLLSPHSDQLLDPALMTDMETAGDRLVHAVRAGEHLVVNGDYDTDGITGTALLVSELRRMGARVDFFIPDRERDGYGITPRLVQRAGEVGVHVLLSVDCGSSDHAAIEQAHGLGIDVIVVDHHEIPLRPAAARAVLNPKRSDCAYPFKGLCAAGVAYKLLQAVCMGLGRSQQPEDGLDLVAIGTLADVQPLVEENRVLTALGLQRLRSVGLRPGLQALLARSGVRGDEVRSGHIGFRMAPRINAVGRIARGKIGVDLLLADDAAAAERLAHEMEAQNERRRMIQEQILSEAREKAARAFDAASTAALVLASETWHPGVVGIVAARLADEFNVPVALVGIQKGIGRGSVRSAGGVNVRAALDAAADLLERYGGHKEAAGLTVRPEHIAALAERFESAVRLQRDGAAARSLHVDTELAAAEVGLALVEALDRLEPFGPGHPEPLFLFRGLEVEPGTRIVGEGHLKLDTVLPGGRRLDAIAFGWGRDLAPAAVIGTRIDAVGHLRRQDPRWGADCQLVVTDLRAAEA